MEAVNLMHQPLYSPPHLWVKITISIGKETALGPRTSLGILEKEKNLLFPLVFKP
jgi:hypothetical protein